MVVAWLMAMGWCVSAGEPAFVTADPRGGWAEGGYYVHNNMWNSLKYTPCTSVMRAWSHGRWEVSTRMNNKTGDGAVKTYPNVHKDFDKVPISSLESLTSRFASESPQVGIYNVAFDLWINGIAKAGCTEIMIWTENFHQVPGGKLAEEAVLGQRRYKVYRRASDGYIAFVAADTMTSGTLDLLEIVRWVIERGWLPQDSVLNQVCYGVEMVSTDDAEATFRVTDFAIDARLKAGGQEKAVPR